MRQAAMTMHYSSPVMGKEDQRRCFLGYLLIDFLHEECPAK